MWLRQQCTLATSSRVFAWRGLRVEISELSTTTATLPRRLETRYIGPCLYINSKIRPHAGSRVVRIDPLRFLAGCRTRRLNQVWLCLTYILACFIVLLFIRAPFYVLLVFVAMCSVFWLFWLSYLYLPSDWLERPLWGSLTVARGSSPESPGRRVRMIFLVYCIASLFYYVFVLSSVIYYPTVMARYSLFVLKVPLNPKQTNKQNNMSFVGSVLAWTCKWSLAPWFRPPSAICEGLCFSPSLK